MSPLVFVGVLAICAAIALGCLALLGGKRSDPKVSANLLRGLGDKPSSKDPDSGPETWWVYDLAAKATPKSRVRTLEQLIVRAGRPPEWPIEKVVAAKLIVAAVLALLGSLYISAKPSLISVLAAVVVTGVGYFLPELLLISRGMERRQKISDELADTLDQMTIGVEAGLGFDSAMAKSGKNGTGPLAEEFLRTLAEIQVGHSRREAYTSLADRANVPDLRRFVRAVIQADAHGIAVAEVLRMQAGEMRIKRRQRAEEAAMKLPVKVLFPLMFCILPVLFIVLLGPAVLSIIETYS